MAINYISCDSHSTQTCLASRAIFNGHVHIIAFAIELGPWCTSLRLIALIKAAIVAFGISEHSANFFLLELVKRKGSELYTFFGDLKSVS